MKHTWITATAVIAVAGIVTAAAIIGGHLNNKPEPTDPKKSTSVTVGQGSAGETTTLEDTTPEKTTPATTEQTQPAIDSGETEPQESTAPEPEPPVIEPAETEFSVT